MDFIRNILSHSCLLIGAGWTGVTILKNPEIIPTIDGGNNSVPDNGKNNENLEDNYDSAPLLVILKPSYAISWRAT
jgi:hypothetical protein